MDVSTIRAEIQSEVHGIINILEKIQTELDELNTFTKPNGALDTAVKEGFDSTNAVFRISGCSLQTNEIDITQMHTNIINSTLKESQLTTDLSSIANNTTSQ